MKQTRKIFYLPNISTINAEIARQSIKKKDLAQYLNITQPLLSEYLHGNHKIPSHVLNMIAKYLNKPIEYFFNE